MNIKIIIIKILKKERKRAKNMNKEFGLLKIIANTI
jgi:hypothetical protein